MRPIREAYIEQCKAAGKKGYIRSLEEIPKNTAGIKGRIAALRIFPIKALGELLVDEVMIDEYGLRSNGGLRDRALMIGKRSTKRDGQAPEYVRFSQRQEPRLSQIRPSWDDRGLCYQAPGMPVLTVDLSELNEIALFDEVTTTVEPVPGEIVTAIAETGPITHYIRKYLKQFRNDVDDLDVLIPRTDFRRATEERHRHNPRSQTIFSDGAHTTVASASSLAFIQDIINRKNGTRATWFEDARQIPMAAMRPNIEVEGWPTHLEDILGNASIRGIAADAREAVEMLFGDLYVRCKVTQVDQATGTFAEDGEPFKTFLEKRPLRLDGSSKSPTFAVSADFPETAWGKTIKKGDVIVAGREKMVPKL